MRHAADGSGQVAPLRQLFFAVEVRLRLGTAGAVFIAVAIVASAVGIIATHALTPGFARLTGNGTALPAALLSRVSARD